LERFFTEICEKEDSRWQPNGIMEVCDPQHVNPFLTMYKWLELTKNLPYQELHDIMLTHADNNPA
jgi:hypothetical protein